MWDTVPQIELESPYILVIEEESSEKLIDLYRKDYDYSNLNRMDQLYLTFEKVGTVS